MMPLWLGHFTRQMAFHYGIGGWIVLALIAVVLLFAALAVLLVLMKAAEGAAALGRAFARGWRKAGATPPSDGP